MKNKTLKKELFLIFFIQVFFLFFLNITAFAEESNPIENAEKKEAENKSSQTLNSSTSSEVKTQITVVPPEKKEEIETIEEIEVVIPSVAETSNVVVTERAFVLPYPKVVKKNRLLFTLDHRANQNITGNSSKHDLIGFDNGFLKIGLGLRYGLLDNLDFGITRLNGTYETSDTYDFDVKYIIYTKKEKPIDLLIGADFTWFADSAANDSSGIGIKNVAGKTIFSRLYLTGGIGFHSSSSSQNKKGTDKKYSFYLPFTCELKFFSNFSLIGELSQPIIGYSAGNAAWAGGLKYLTSGHSFSLLLSNTQYISTNGEAAGSIRARKPVLAFSLTREFIY